MNNLDKSNKNKQLKLLEVHVNEWIKIGWKYTIDEVKELEEFYGVKAPERIYKRAIVEGD